MYILLTKKNILMIILSFTIIIILTFSLKHFFSAQKNTNWGLSFREEGKQPVGNASSEYLLGYNSYFVGKDTEKVVYVTFDAGYEAGYIDKILEALKKHNVKATFFVVGTLIKSDPEVIQKITDAGHIIGNHTMTHPNMSKISTLDSFKSELEQVEVLYEQTTGKKMSKYYRPPQGIFSSMNLEMANSLGYKTIFWSLAYVDWNKNSQPTKEEAFKKILPRLHNGTILLLHSTSKTNADILDELLTKIEQEGYTFKSLEELC